MADKKSKPQVDYSVGTPQSHCGNCQHFDKPDSCTKVKGSIGRRMWCKLWRKTDE